MNFQFFNHNIIKSSVLFLLLFLTFFIPFMAMQNFSPANDEVTHLPSGYSYLKTGEIKLNPQHPPLIKMLAAFPLLFLDLKFNKDDPSLAGPKTNEWQFGRDFLSANNVDKVMFWGRIQMILLSVLLGWYIFKWGKDLFGYEAGIIGLFIYAFMPNIIAHSQLVTTDLGVSAFSFIALYYLWKLLKSDFNKRRYLICSGIFLGLALGSKFSAIFLLLIPPVLLVIYFSKKSGNTLYRLNSYLRIILPIYGLAFLVVWSLYFFPSDPAVYYKGLKTVYADNNPDFQYYLNGDFKSGGWWYYFIEAFIIKTPVPFLVALLVAFVYPVRSLARPARGAGRVIRQKAEDLGEATSNGMDKSFILLPAALFLFVASWKAHNIGVRYILVIYPFLILFVSGWISNQFRISNLEFRVPRIKIKIVPILIFILGGWYMYSAINIYPDYLSYFNELIGGSDNGYKYLDDSNIDWGQDLKRLAEYQKKNPDLQVIYTWNTFTGAAKMYGVENVLPLDLKDQRWVDPRGRYAINTHALIRLKLAAQKYKNEKLNWLDQYKFIDRIGQSFFIYDFD